MPSCIEFSVPAPPWMNERDARVYGRSRASFGIEAQVRGRSGLAFKHGVLGHVGTIDSDYRGEIGVLLLNTGRQPYEVKVGDRVAQLVFAPVLLPDLVEVDELPETQRGAGGFGSTGI